MGEKKSMKYAFIVLIVIYLITYGCSPSNDEKATDSHEQTVPATVEQLPEGEMVAIPDDQHESSDAVEQDTVPEEAVAVPPEVTTEQVQQPAVEEEQQPADIAVLKNVDNNQELASALQRMVETTNDMVLATRQLVITAQTMLNAGKKVAEEVIDTGEKIIEAQEDPQPVDPSVEQPLDAKKTSDQEVIETLQNVISTANEVIEATNQALSKSLDAQKQ
jgi:hypothetical protein